jgi:dihydrofolate reductase
MARVVLYMSMSLDGFIAGPRDDVSRPLGVEGDRLHAWGTRPPASELSARVFDEMRAAGAVIAGRRTFELAGGWMNEHHDGVPVFVPTRAVPEGEPPANVLFVADGIESCVAQAKAAAGDRDVVLRGAHTAQQCLRAGLLDEMEIHLVPVVLGEGRRLFDALGPDHIELTLDRAIDAPGVVHLRYRVHGRKHPLGSRS